MSNKSDDEAMKLAIVQITMRLMAIKTLFSVPCSLMLTVRFPQEPHVDNMPQEFVVGDDDILESIAALQRRHAEPEDIQNAPSTGTKQ